MAHSLRKWIGLRGKNLKKHGLIRKGNRILESNGASYVFNVDSSTCALCVHHYDKEHYDKETPEGSPCQSCPLFKVKGGACDDSLSGQDRSEFNDFTHNGNPEPMTELLEKAQKA